jgi:hypothetical protein
MMFASAVFGSNQKLFGVSGCAARLARKHHDSLQYVMRPPEFENLPYHELGVDRRSSQLQTEGVDDTKDPPKQLPMLECLGAEMAGYITPSLPLLLSSLLMHAPRQVGDTKRRA